MKAIICGLFVFLRFFSCAQSDSENPFTDDESSVSVNFGVGLGLSYGGMVPVYPYFQFLI